MTVLKTCRPCIHTATCERRRSLIEAIRGLGVSTVTHRCPDVTLPYRPGQPVWAEVNDLPYREFEPDGDSGPTKGWFPGHFLSQSTRSNTRGLVVIRDFAASECGTLEFIPVKRTDHGEGAFGICKVLWSRIRPRGGEDEPICRACKNPYRVTGCEMSGTDCPHRPVPSVAMAVPDHEEHPF